MQTASTTIMLPLIDRSVYLEDVCGGDGPGHGCVAPKDHPVGIVAFMEQNSNMFKFKASFHYLLDLSRPVGPMISVGTDLKHLLFVPLDLQFFNCWHKAERERSNRPACFELRLAHKRPQLAPDCKFQNFKLK